MNNRPRVSHDPKTTTRVSGGTNFTGGAAAQPKMTGGGTRVTSRLPDGAAKMVSNPSFNSGKDSSPNGDFQHRGG